MVRCAAGTRHRFPRCRVRPVLAVALGLALLAVGVTPATGQVRELALVERWMAPLETAALAMADVLRWGEPQLLAATAEGVVVLGAADEDRWDVVGRLPAIPFPPIAVAVDDVTGDGRPDVVVGTGQAGTIHLYHYEMGEWHLLARARYLWSAVVSLAVADFTGDGAKEILAATRAGDVYLFARAETDLQLLWQAGSPATAVGRVAAADLSGDGQVEAILVGSQGYVGIWSWDGENLRPVWENYPWGLVTSVSVTDVDRDGRPDVVINTTERILYAYGWTAGGYAVKRHEPLVSLVAMAAGDVTGDGRPELVGSGGDGLLVIGLEPGRLPVLGQALGLEQARQLLVTPDGRIIAATGGALHILAPAPADYLKVWWDRREVNLSAAPVFVGADLLLSLRDWAAILGLGLYWDSEQRRVTLVRGLQYAVFEIGETRAMVNGRPVTLERPPLLREGRTYAGTDVATLFGVSADWNPRRRELTLAPPGLFRR